MDTVFARSEQAFASISRAEVLNPARVVLFALKPQPITNLNPDCPRLLLVLSGRVEHRMHNVSTEEGESSQGQLVQWIAGR